MKIISHMQPFLKCFLLIGLCFIFSGCQKSTKFIEIEDPQYQKANTYIINKQYNEALVLLLKIIEQYPKAPESHLEAGRIYLSELQDPITAIYHFRKYLESKPDSPQSPMVHQLIETAKKQFARQLPGQPFEQQGSSVADMIQQLRDENHQLKQTLSHLQKTSTLQSIHSVSKSTQRYTVQANDTLSTISQKMYHSPNHWQAIYQANTSVLKSPNSLKVGQELIIPEL